MDDYEFTAILNLSPGEISERFLVEDIFGGMGTDGFDCDLELFVDPGDIESCNLNNNRETIATHYRHCPPSVP